MEGRRRDRRSEAASGSAGQMFAGQLIYGELAERSSQDIRSHYSPDMALGMILGEATRRDGFIIIGAVSCVTLF